MIIIIKKKKIYLKIDYKIKYLLYLMDKYLINGVQIHLSIYMDSDEIKFVISNPTYINSSNNSYKLSKLINEYIEKYEIVSDNIFDIISWIEIRIISNNIIESYINYIILVFIKIYLYIIKNNV